MAATTARWGLLASATDQLSKLHELTGQFFIANTFKCSRLQHPRIDGPEDEPEDGRRPRRQGRYHGLEAQHYRPRAARGVPPAGAGTNHARGHDSGRDGAGTFRHGQGCRTGTPSRAFATWTAASTCAPHRVRLGRHGTLWWCTAPSGREALKLMCHSYYLLFVVVREKVGHDDWTGRFHVTMSRRPGYLPICLVFFLIPVPVAIALGLYLKSNSKYLTTLSIIPSSSSYSDL